MSHSRSRSLAETIGSVDCLLHALTFLPFAGRFSALRVSKADAVLGSRLEKISARFVCDMSMLELTPPAFTGQSQQASPDSMPFIFTPHMNTKLTSHHETALSRKHHGTSNILRTTAGVASDLFDQIKQPCDEGQKDKSDASLPLTSSCSYFPSQWVLEAKAPFWEQHWRQQWRQHSYRRVIRLAIVHEGIADTAGLSFCITPNCFEQADPPYWWMCANCNKSKQAAIRKGLCP
jgi:hypothetical protein